VAAVGAKFKKTSSKVPEQGLLPDGSSVVPAGRVWRRVSRVGGQSDVELITLSNDDDPNAIYVSEEALMNECKVCVSSKYLQCNDTSYIRLHAVTTFVNSVLQNDSVMDSGLAGS
jgi:hypothetical protein